MMMDQDSPFMLSLMSYLFKKLRITIKMVGSYNHKSLQAEHGIKSFSSLLSKHLKDQGQMWHKCLSLAAFAYNIFHTPNLGIYSPMNLCLEGNPEYSLTYRQTQILRSLACTKITTHCWPKGLIICRRCCRISR